VLSTKAVSEKAGTEAGIEELRKVSEKAGTEAGIEDASIVDVGVYERPDAREVSIEIEGEDAG